MQKRAARITLDGGPFFPSVPILHKLSSNPFYEEVKVSQFAMAYKKNQQ